MQVNVASRRVRVDHEKSDLQYQFFSISFALSCSSSTRAYISSSQCLTRFWTTSLTVASTHSGEAGFWSPLTVPRDHGSE